MLINPKVAINQGWVKFPENVTEEFKQKCIQPNALDITADRIYQIVPTGEPATLSEQSKKFHALAECIPDEDGYIDLLPHTVYDIHSDFYVNVPVGVAGELVIRSTLNRAGLALNSGIWDSGYVGHLGMTIYNRTNGIFKLQVHTRVCQLKFIRSDVSDVVYAGQYNTKMGEHWTNSK